MSLILDVKNQSMLFPKKVVDNRKKNPTRKISPSIAEKVRKRDKYCIICENAPIEEIHHVFYWGERQFDSWRNWADRLVWLCYKCHHWLHFTDHPEYRQFTKDYLKKLYD